jgi:hypothetical protein
MHDELWPEIPDAMLIVWVVYERPRDFPDSFVVRRQAVMGKGKPILIDTTVHIAATLSKARKLLPNGLIRLDRMDGDEPQIVETWV